MAAVRMRRRIVSAGVSSSAWNPRSSAVSVRESRNLSRIPSFVSRPVSGCGGGLEGRRVLKLARLLYGEDHSVIWPGQN